ncbi:MAG: hypothetical protein WA019_05175 [Candidatus Moraniibacteriota bacterium]
MNLSKTKKQGRVFNFIPGKELKAWVDSKSKELGMSAASFIRYTLLTAKRKDEKK